MVENHIKRILEHDSVIQNINSMLNYPRNTPFAAEQLRKFIELTSKQFKDHLESALQRGDINPVHAQVEILFLKKHVGTSAEPDKLLAVLKSKYDLKKIDNDSVEKIFLELYKKKDKITILKKLLALVEQIISVSEKEGNIVKDMRKIEEHELKLLRKIEISVFGRASKGAVKAEFRNANSAEKSVGDQLSRVSIAVQRMIDNNMLKLNKDFELVIDKKPKNIKEAEILLIKFLAVTYHCLHIHTNNFANLLKKQELELKEEVKYIDQIIKKEHDANILLSYFEKILTHAVRLERDVKPDNPGMPIDIYHEKQLIDKIFNYTRKIKEKLKELHNLMEERKRGHFLRSLKNVNAKHSQMIEGKLQYVRFSEIRLEDFEQSYLTVGSSFMLGNVIVVDDKKNVYPSMFVLDKEGAITIPKKPVPVPVIVRKRNNWFILFSGNNDVDKKISDFVGKNIHLPENVHITGSMPDKTLKLESGDIIQCGVKAIFKFVIKNKTEEREENKATVNAVK